MYIFRRAMCDEGTGCGGAVPLWGPAVCCRHRW